ncbi:unnamed protein product [Closterium sp. NIES-65]|nr:unnamed protein product [Closterium sp. NIES-65]
MCLTIPSRVSPHPQPLIGFKHYRPSWQLASATKYNLRYTLVFTGPATAPKRIALYQRQQQQPVITIPLHLLACAQPAPSVWHCSGAPASPPLPAAPLAALLAAVSAGAAGGSTAGGNTPGGNAAGRDTASGITVSGTSGIGFSAAVVGAGSSSMGALSQAKAFYAGEHSGGGVGTPPLTPPRGTLVVSTCEDPQNRLLFALPCTPPVPSALTPVLYPTAAAQLGGAAKGGATVSVSSTNALAKINYLIIVLNPTQPLRLVKVSLSPPSSASPSTSSSTSSTSSSTSSTSPLSLACTWVAPLPSVWVCRGTAMAAQVSPAAKAVAALPALPAGARSACVVGVSVGGGVAATQAAQGALVRVDF